MFELNRIHASIMAFESQIWASADILRSSLGIKDGDKPDFMIPFFALRLLEAKCIQAYNKIYSQNIEIYGDGPACREATLDDLRDKPFYNKVLLEGRLTLEQIVGEDFSFGTQFHRYLCGFTEEVQNLLGYVNSDKTNNLNIGNVIKSLEKSNALYSYAGVWANVNLAGYTMSDIVLLDEHIKGKWAEMSAETAGEHYTPYDIVDLVLMIFTWHVQKRGVPRPYIRLYDPTCGGAGALTRISENLGRALGKEIRVYGQELNGALAALAKIDAMTRDEETHIAHGNTLVEDKFPGVSFDLSFSNPPYGVSWKNEEKLIKDQREGRLGKAGYPTTADGQLLFIEHVAYKMDTGALAAIVLNGSPLFAGDAGSGESEIRKYLLDNDLVEMIIQLPSGEFFNTGIGTYLWVLNGDKAEKNKNKIVLVNAENVFTKLKKNFGDKNKAIDLVRFQNEVMPAIDQVEDGELVRALPTEFFYYNRQSLRRLLAREAAPAFGDGKTSQEFNIQAVVLEDGTTLSMPQFNNEDDAKRNLEHIATQLDNGIISKIQLDNGGVISMIDEDTLSVSNVENVIEQNYTATAKLTAKFKKATKKSSASITWTVAVSPTWVKDEERIAFSKNADTNTNNIHAFIKQWVSNNPDHVELLDNVVGVEINFNAIFPKKTGVRATSEVLAELSTLGLTVDL